MSIRGTRVLLIGATTRAGQGLVEALLALGAEVIATGALRTELDQLVADMHQHERLHQADVDPTSPEALARVMVDVSRSAPLDVILVVLEAGPPGPLASKEPRKALRGMIEHTFETACWALRTGVATLARTGGGRIVVLTDGPGTPDPEAPIRAAAGAAVRVLIESNQKPVAAQGIGLLGVSTHAFHGRPAALAERVLEFLDPDHPLPVEPFV